jgi:hypothetical protein
VCSVACEGFGTGDVTVQFVPRIAVSVLFLPR